MGSKYYKAAEGRRIKIINDGGDEAEKADDAPAEEKPGDGEEKPADADAGEEPAEEAEEPADQEAAEEPVEEPEKDVDEITGAAEPQKHANRGGFIFLQKRRMSALWGMV